VAPQDAVFTQMVFALASGAGTLRLSAEAAGWFHDRYAAWLVTHKPGRTGSPLEIWDENGRGFLGRFKAIGQGVRPLAAGEEIRLDDLRESARRVEALAPCPWCPSPMARQTVDLDAWTVPFAPSAQALPAHA
jgi:hypothetical protein